MSSLFPRPAERAVRGTRTKIYIRPLGAPALPALAVEDRGSKPRSLRWHGTIHRLLLACQRTEILSRCPAFPTPEAPFMSAKLTRRDLYDLVWSKPRTTMVDLP